MRQVRRFFGFVIVIAILAAVGFFFFKGSPFGKEETKADVITESALYRIINVSKLSTYECVYNDICTVMNKDNPNQVDYYCAYDAKVSAGIDFENVSVKMEGDRILVTLPPVSINDVNVDIASLDYMFENKAANTNTVSKEAYNACIEDVTRKSQEETKIYELAEQNARNIVEALIKPFIEHMDGETAYTLEIQTGEGK